MKQAFTVRGQLADVHQKRIYPAQVAVENGRITSITELESVEEKQYILPGFVDAHVHVESSMLIPSQFARLAVVHGTVATISDPHEIANVCGTRGVEYMIGNGRSVPFKFNFGAPSCVPATSFETAGATVSVADIEDLMKREEVLYLTEMMNFPGVLHNDADVMSKIAAAKRYNKPVDGHAPGLRGEQAKQYIGAGISTDHECFTAEEALDKLGYGMKILVREGSAARNFEALAPLLHEHYAMMMFCSDDKHPDSLVESHINEICARAVALGVDIFKVLQVACVNPVDHYKLRVGLLRPNDFADFIITEDLEHFKVLQTYIDGELVAEGGKSLITVKQESKTHINSFHCSEKTVASFAYEPVAPGQIPVIEALDGQLITNKIFVPHQGGAPVSDTESDILKIVVVNRYKDAPIAKGLIKNFGLKKGAIASSVAHDSHNIVAVGVDDESLCAAVNAVIREKGGVSCTADGNTSVLPLPVAGLMSAEDGYLVAERYAAIDREAKALGSTLSAPFMTLSFMALLVIPHLKLSDLGLFDGDRFEFV